MRIVDHVNNNIINNLIFEQFSFNIRFANVDYYRYIHKVIKAKLQKKLLLFFLPLTKLSVFIQTVYVNTGFCHLIIIS